MVQGDCDVEWKFARTRLWMNYIDDGSTLPVPFNMIPTPKSCRYALYWLRDLCRPNDDSHLEFERGKRQTFIKVRILYFHPGNLGADTESYPPLKVSSIMIDFKLLLFMSRFDCLINVLIVL